MNQILREQKLSKVIDRSITDRDELIAELDDIKEQGYATATGEYLKGMHCIGAAITILNDEVQGAVSVSGPIKRMTGNRFNEGIPRKVLETANVIEVNFNQAV